MPLDVTLAILFRDPEPQEIGAQLTGHGGVAIYLKGTSNCKYPPAEPGALRLLAPQRGLIAIGQNQNRTVIARSMVSVFVAVIPAKAGIQWLLDSGSRFTCPE